MYSGLALLMDVHRPARPNGYGIVHLAGSGFTAPLAYDAEPLSTRGTQMQIYGRPLVEAGYTVFAVNFRLAPRFRYPAAIEDVQRAVRFVRHHAKRFGIDPAKIGAVGGSSGGYLVLMLGTLDGTGDANDLDPINRESAKVQTVVARAAPSDLLNLPTGPAMASFLGMILPPGPSLPPTTSIEYRTFRDASPVYQVTKDDAPLLLLHGDADDVVPFKHSELMTRALEEAGVRVALLRIAGGGHFPTFVGATNPPDYIGEMVRWFERHLKTR
jgi:acetyl esterase/lipase